MAIPARIWDEVDAAEGSKPKEKKVTAEHREIETAVGLSGGMISVPIPNEPELSYDYMSDLFFVEALKHVHKENGLLSMRALAKALGISRSTLTTRIKSATEKQVITEQGLSAYIKSSAIRGSA